MNWEASSPRVAALRLLHSRFRFLNGSDLEPLSSLDLQSFQREAVQQATAIMARRRGVLIADAVGLGKTFIGLGLIERAVTKGQRVLVLTPASLKRMWRSELRRLATLTEGPPPEILSHTQLARGHLHGREFDLLVVDEAHAFKNPRTRRYRALRLLCRHARVVLITATPVNNSLADLYFQLRLFCSDRAFRDLGVGSLRTALIDEPRDVTLILGGIMIRRTRREVRLLAASEPSSPLLRFPDRIEMCAVGYEMPISAARIGELLATLTFPAYRLRAGPGFSRELLRFGFLKRMESSAYAMRATLSRQIQFYEELIAALERGMLLRPATFRSLYDVGDDALQLVLEGVTLEEAAAVPADLEADARRELLALRAWRRELPETGDDKSRKLEAIIRGRPSESRTIVFTEYRDTARHLWSSLRRRFPTALIDGSGAWIGENKSSRPAVIERFAPRSNGGRPVHPREAIAVLVATDVLSEGMNLQDADAVVSYDLPWNPIRLVQRAGRVDRMGSEQDVVSIYNFLPDREFDAFLGLAKTIRRKLETVRSSVGLERPVLESAEDVESVSRAVQAGDATVLDRIEIGPDPELRRQYAESGYSPHPGAVPVAILPGAVGRRLLIGVECGAEWHEIVVEPQGGPRVQRFDTDHLIRRALGCNCVSVRDPAAFIAAAEDELRRMNDVARLAAERTSPLSRAARIIRRHLMTLQLDSDPGLYDRADMVLTGLTQPVDPETEHEIGQMIRHAWNTAEELIDALEAVLGKASAQPCCSERWTLTAVIVAD